MTTLASVKRMVEIGDTVEVINYLKDYREKRKVTKKQSNGIYTYSPTRKSWNSKQGVEIFLGWQKARNTNIIDEENEIIIQFLAHKEEGVSPLDNFKNNVWLELIVPK